MLIKDLLEREQVEYHVIEARTKGIDSFARKTERQHQFLKYKDPLKEITDLSGIRVVVYYTDDVDKVARIIEREFLIDRENSLDKGSLLKPQEFGYRSVHYVVSISESRQELCEWNNFTGFKAEIQIRTVLQHAWAAIDHKLRYKKESDVPFPLSRKLFRLSGLLELADEEFLNIRGEVSVFGAESRRRIAAKDTNLQINAITLGEYLKSSERIKVLVNIAHQSGLEIHEDDSHSLSLLVSFCAKAGILSIGQLEEFLESVIRHAQKFFTAIRLSSGGEWQTSPCFLLMYLLVGARKDIFSDVYLQDWSSDIVGFLRLNSSILSGNK